MGISRLDFNCAFRSENFRVKERGDDEWVRIDGQGKISGPCGTSRNKRNPDRCLPRSKAQSLSKVERAATARKKNRKGAKRKTGVLNTKAAKVKSMSKGEVVPETRPKRRFRGKAQPGTAVARGCGVVMKNRRKRTKGAVTQS